MRQWSIFFLYLNRLIVLHRASFDFPQGEMLFLLLGGSLNVVCCGIWYFYYYYYNAKV